ncbi:Translin-1 [Spiromyces aspiralis]|uniref:Translin-1 n=1 Tax=Spiromyces aspiralis TaxID=68401 RepID=A0ACC1HPL4_9FUNG|nr:Translin-1 [Spiromyces aspiralis]
MQEIDKSVKKLELALTQAKVRLDKIHSVKLDEGIVKSLEPHFQAIREKIEELKALEPRLLYKFNHLWTREMQTAVYLVAMAVYLEREEMAGLTDIENYLGIKVNISNDSLDEFKVTIEEYLLGLILIPNELARLAVNAVTTGNFGLPQKISVFVANLYSGFQLLNLKNDILRRRFDSIKYDIKRIEQIVYDVSVRQLVGKDDGGQVLAGST